MHKPAVRDEIEIRDPRRLGIYYTPEDVATVLVQWALPKRQGSVLDPSFGGCSLLRAALALRRHMHSSNQVAVFGVDVDPGALAHARELHKLGVPKANLIQADFFAIDSSRFGGRKFDAIVGNPPYIRHHWHHGASRELALALASANGVRLPGRADAWAFFVVHALSFLQQGGRLALLLPVAILHADYAQSVLEHLSTKFENVRLIELAERLFPGASEATIVLAASGYMSSGAARISFARAPSARDLACLLRPDAPAISVTCDRRRTWALLGLPAAAQSAWKRAVESPSVHTFGDIAKIPRRRSHGRQ